MKGDWGGEPFIWGTGKAIGYPSDAFIHIDYHLYGPGWVDLDSGEGFCGQRRPCDIQSIGVVVGPGHFAMCVNTFESLSDDIATACADLDV
jgi:hypothetical protein